MTPQQKKADELVERFYDPIEDFDLKNDYPEMSKRMECATQCAIICVEEVLEATKVEVDRPDTGCYTVHSKYWQSVINELKSRL